MGHGHRYDAVLIACMDDAIYEYLDRFFRGKLGLHCDEVKIAGGSKNLVDEGPRRDAVLEDIALSVEKHGVRKILLANHEDCGKYGGSAYFQDRGLDERAFHAAELQKARAVVAGRFPGITVRLFFIRVNSSCEEIG